MAMATDRTPSSVDEVSQGLREVGYLPGESTALVSFLATKLGKPVLVEGPAGVGKTQLAKSLADFLHRRLVRLQCYEGLDEAKALYEWNYRKQLLRIQAEASGTGWDAVQEDIFGEEFLLARPLMTAIASEEPVVPDDFAGYLRIAEALDLRVVGGETHFTRFDLKPFFENPRLPILQPDPMRGGLTDLRKIATIADTWGMTIAPHLFPELNVQLLASIPNGLWIEDMGLSDDLWVDPVPVVNGMITAPERPGHGLAFKPEILRDCAVKD